jgi:hypothetical protein
LAACRIDPDLSPQFKILREHWRRSGYPSIEDDLTEAFRAISKEVQANHCRIVPRFAAVLGDFLLHKYRQKNRAAKEGASGAWRIYALFDKQRNVLYPIIVYPKKAWQDASEQLIIECVHELTTILHQRELSQNSN